MRRRSGAPALAAALLLGGCATSDHMYMVDRSVHCALLGGDPIEFLAERPERAHVEVARIEASSVVFVPTSWETLRLYLCREALNVRADAVIDLEQGHVDYSIGFTPFKLDWTNKRLGAIAIRFLEPGQQPQDVDAPAQGPDGEILEEPPDEPDADLQTPSGEPGTPPNPR